MGQMIKGITLKSRAAFIEANYGPDGMQTILSTLSGEAKDLFTDPMRIKATGWYAFELQVEVDEAICKVLAKGDPNVYRLMGGFSAEYHDKQLAMKQFTEPWKFLTLQTMIWSRFFKPGQAEVIKVSDREAKIHVYGFRSVHENCETNMGFFHRSLELCGAEDVSVVETQCTKDAGVEYCEYRLRWH